MGFSPINLAGDGSARSTEDRRAISVRLATVKRGQSWLLRVFEVGCSATSSAAIYPIPKLTVQLMKIGLASEGMRVEMRVASLAPAVGVFTPAGTCPGRLRRHCVIGYADPGQNPSAVGFGSRRVRGRGRRQGSSTVGAPAQAPWWRPGPKRRGASRRAWPGATLGATETNDFSALRTSLDSRQERIRGDGPI